MKKRILCLILGLLLLLPLAGCSNDTPAAEGSDTVSDTAADSGSDTAAPVPSDTEAPEPEATVALVKNGEAQFLIISKGADYNTAAENLQKGLTAKTGVLFTFRKFETAQDTLPKIYVGGMYADYVESDILAPYGTCGFLEKDGNWYLCCDAVADLNNFVTKFLASITKDMVTQTADGKAELILPASMFTLNLPELPPVGKLLGAPLYDYRVVISESANGSERFMASELVRLVREKTGGIIELVTDKEAPAAREIVLGDTARAGSDTFYDGSVEAFSYALKGEGTSLYVGYDSVYSMSAVWDELEKLFGESDHPSMNISGTVDTPDLWFAREQATDIRVMTCNVQYVNYDISGKDPKLRMQITAEAINAYLPDFVGLQECEGTMRSALFPCLDERYERAEVDDPRGKTTYFPIIYRTDLWKLEESGIGDYPHNNHPWGYVWATFSRVDDPTERFTMMNLHFTFDANWEDGYGVGLAEEINARVAAELAAEPNKPIAITGDYNNSIAGKRYAALIKDLPIATSFECTENTNVEDGAARRRIIDHCTVSYENVDVIAHRRMDAYSWGEEFASDHPWYFTDLRLK
ncbi:MAG: hypothetical protein E7668_05775 [Ruminococcaceae bacterium]|nr:hypothetical protein [Oscillospiraceae bacterium]